MLKQSIDGLRARNIRAGFSILGGGGGDNVPLPTRTRLPTLLKLAEPRWGGFLQQVRAAASVLVGWGITHFDIDFEGGLAQDLNVTRLTAMMQALRCKGCLVTLTAEVWSLQPLYPLLANAKQRPDLVQAYSTVAFLPISTVARVRQ